ncbi:MAG: hypothetical protein ACQERR_07740, partial [Pseudomonadota bacterium]
MGHDPKRADDGGGAVEERLGLRPYALITANYWGFTITDGAIRMLVVLYFHELGFSPLAIAM